MGRASTRDLSTRTAYVAGPVSGIPDLNRPAFTEAAHELHHMGYCEVINPTVYGDSQMAADEGHLGWQLIMRKCLRDVLAVDDVWMLEGWQNSDGARIEAFLAAATGILVFDYETGIELPLECNLVVSAT